MADMSNYLENALLNGTLNATTYTAPTTVYVSLWTSNPNDDGSGTEVSGGSYARVAVSFATASGTSGEVLNDAAVEFPTATAGWGVVGWIGVNDALSGGNLMYHTALDTAKTIDTGDIFKIAIGNLSVTLA
tara:strand:+ start:695 stop:1087 length:393 start_codon:yes stop_codon:yes gene_type:complete